jgi:hypothetical protein
VHTKLVCEICGGEGCCGEGNPQQIVCCHCCGIADVCELRADCCPDDEEETNGESDTD